jgi:putative transposase/transposase-like zinc-binding protein
MRPPLEVADIFRQHGNDFRLAYTLSPEQRRVMRAIEQCRTAALGGHVEQCDTCGHQRISYNSCRNRHCPKCQSLAKARWLEAHFADLLPVQYFHVVFTLPEQLASVALQNKRVVYNLLFATAAETLRTIAADPRHLGAEIGFLAVLHTWGQTLGHHPHLHCVIPGGGLAVDGARWVSCRCGFFLSVKVLARLFRRLFLQGLERAYENDQLTFNGSLAYLAKARAFRQLLANLRAREWCVYAKAPFGGPEQVLAYLGRYTHRVAISNHRLLSLKEGNVTFKWRDYRHANQQSLMTLKADEFIRRFLLHVLPHGFQRIRQFGLLANRRRRDRLARCRQLLGVAVPTAPPLPGDYKSLYETVTGESLDHCRVCRSGYMKFARLLVPLVSYAGSQHITAGAVQSFDSS